MWLDRIRIATMSLLMALPGALQAQEPPAPKPTPAPVAPKTGTPKITPRAKGKAKPAPADNAPVKPQVAASAKARSKELATKRKNAQAAPALPPVDINRASKEELLKLPGMTSAFADKLIANRPFKTKSALVTKDVLPYSLYYALKGRMTAVN